MYTASIIYHQGTEREFGYDGIFPTRGEAMAQIEYWSEGMGMAWRAWIDGKEVEPIFFDKLYYGSRL